MSQESAAKLNEAFERKAEQENAQGACGQWVCAVSTYDRNNVVIYRDLNPPSRENIEVVRITFEPYGAFGPINPPTLDEVSESHDFLQAVMLTAWRLGYRPGKVTRTGAEQFVKALQNEGLVLVQGIGTRSWRDAWAQNPPPRDPIDRLRNALGDFLADAFTPDPEPPVPENGR